MKGERVFISYAHEDLAFALRIHNDLQSNGIPAWIDKVNLKPGTNWKNEIRKAIRSCSYFVVLLSNNSVSKRGYCQKEIKLALEVFDELPYGAVFILPVKLDECDIIDPRLNEIHQIQLQDNYKHGIEKVVSAIKENHAEIELMGAEAIQNIESIRDLKQSQRELITNYLDALVADIRIKRDLYDKELADYSELLYLLSKSLSYNGRQINQDDNAKRIAYLLGAFIVGCATAAVTSAVVNRQPSNSEDNSSQSRIAGAVVPVSVEVDAAFGSDTTYATEYNTDDRSNRLFDNNDAALTSTSRHNNRNEQIVVFGDSVPNNLHTNIQSIYIESVLPPQYYRTPMQPETMIPMQVELPKKKPEAPKPDGGAGVDTSVSTALIASILVTSMLRG